MTTSTTPSEEANEGILLSSHDNRNPSSSLPISSSSTTTTSPPDLLEGKTVEELIDIMKQMGPEIAAKKKNGLHIEYLKKVAASLSVRKDLAKQELVHRIFDRLEKKRKYDEMDGVYQHQQPSNNSNNSTINNLTLSSSSADGVGIGGQHLLTTTATASSSSLTTTIQKQRSNIDDLAKKDNNNNNNKNLPLLAEVANEIQNDHHLSTNPSILPTTTLASSVGVGNNAASGSSGDDTPVVTTMTTSKERSQKHIHTAQSRVVHGITPLSIADSSKCGRQAEISAEEIRQNIKLTITLNLKENEAIIRESWLAIAHMKTMRANAQASNDSIEEKELIDEELARLYNSVSYYSERVKQLRVEQVAHN